MNPYIVTYPGWTPAERMVLAHSIQDARESATLAYGAEPDSVREHNPHEEKEAA